jgi:hypothetical protein
LLVGGHGTIEGIVTVGAGGILSPGNSLGTLSIVGDVFFRNNSQFLVAVNPTNVEHSDWLKITGTVDLAGGTVRHYVDPNFPGEMSDYLATNPEAVENDKAAPDKKWRILSADEFEGKFNPVVEPDPDLPPALALSLYHISPSFPGDKVFLRTSACFPLPRLAGRLQEKSGPAGPGEGVHPCGAKRRSLGLAVSK